MKFLSTKQERLSARLTILISIILVLLLFVVGPPYMDPPLEYGVSVNFGTSNLGSGMVQPKTPTIPKSNQTPDKTPKQVSEVSNSNPDFSKEILTSDSNDLVVKKSEKEATQKRDEADRIRKQNEATERKKKELDALISGIGSDNGTESGSEGDDLIDGDKGQLDGDPYMPSYFGQSGNGIGGVGYGLNGRGMPYKSKVIPDCNEEGRVVVKIHVNRSGKVTKAIPGEKGTTGDICLYEAAKKTALTHKWPPDSNAPIDQIGFVIVEFSVRQ